MADEGSHTPIAECEEKIEYPLEVQYCGGKFCVDMFDESNDIVTRSLLLLFPAQLDVYARETSLQFTFRGEHFLKKLFQIAKVAASIQYLINCSWSFPLCAKDKNGEFLGLSSV